MGKASSAKKVARAARSGGRARRARNSSWAWPASLACVAILGVALVVMSRNQNTAGETPPTLTDHWHAAYGFDICGTFQPDIPQPAKLIGLHTHSDGVVHVEPQNSADTGKHATFGRFVSGIPGLKVTKDEIKLPGGKTYKNGDKCGGKRAIVQAKVNGKRFTGDPRDIRIKQHGIITIAFLPPGSKIPDPPDAAAKIAAADSGSTETAVPNTSTTAPATATTETTAGSTTSSSSP